MDPKRRNAILAGLALPVLVFCLAPTMSGLGRGPVVESATDPGPAILWQDPVTKEVAVEDVAAGVHLGIDARHWIVGKQTSHTTGFLQIHRRASMDTAGVAEDVFSRGIPISRNSTLNNWSLFVAGNETVVVQGTLRVWTTVAGAVDANLEMQHIVGVPGIKAFADSSIDVDTNEIVSLTLDCSGSVDMPTVTFREVERR